MKIKYIIVALISISLFSCTDGFDRDNSNPNNPTTVPTYGIYNYATKSIVGTTIRGSFGSARMALPWVQYSAQRNYTEEDRYQYRDATGLSIFNEYYRQGLNFKDIIKLNTAPETKDIAATYGDNNIQIAASRIFLCYIFQNLADTYGDVPYWSYGGTNPDFEGLDVDNITPKYAKQEDIYADILKELQEAVEQIDNANEKNIIFYKNAAYIGENVFGNDVQKLRKFANSLRLRVATRLKNSPLSALAASHINDAIASGVMTSNEDSAGVEFENNSVNPAPNYEAFFIDNRTDYTVSKTFVDLLKGDLANSGLVGIKDPRLQKIVAPVGVSKGSSLANDYKEISFNEPTDTINKYYQGMPFGLPSGLTVTQRASASLYSYSLFKPTYKEYFMTYAEVAFLVSEANSWDQTNYEEGVKASMEQWGVSPADITAYIAILPAANEENVLNQKYIALFMQPYEAWAEYRRTGFPKFLVKPGDEVQLIKPIDGKLTYTFEPTSSVIAKNGVMTDLPARINYPYTEPTLNGANYKEAAARIGGDKLTTKLIWDNN